MPYPPLPVEKQYGAWFPEVSTRAVPENKAVKNVESSPVSMHGSGGEQRSETLSQPKKIDMGVLRLWLDGGGRKSKPYDDGPSFDHGAHQIKKVEDGEEGFNFAPGTDEKSLKINWEVYGLESIKSAKLELYCKGSFKPIWELHWGNAWGKQAKGIEAFKAITKPSGDKGITAAGELAFAEVKVDTALKVKDDDGTEETAFPKGLMTVARSPYQLRLTVSGCTADKTPADGDDFVYPMTAWTYAHVLIDSFSFKFGDPKWLAAARDDVHADYKPLITGDNGLEKKIIEELRGFVKSNDGKTEVMQEGTNHIVALTTAYNKNWVKPEFDVFRDTWGLGTRIPIVAMGRIKNLAFQPTDEKAADVMWNARLVWDWQEPDPKRLETIVKAQKTHMDGKADLDFLKAAVKESSEKLLPKGSFNCPPDFGGKLGQDDAPFFLPQPTKGNGNGSPPYEIKPLTSRKWAVVSRFDDKGECGVIMFPSRLAGDAYKVKTYLWREGLDTRDELRDPGTAVGSPGSFIVHRRIQVHHLLVGDLPGVDVQRAVDAMVAGAMGHAYLKIDVTTTRYTGKAYTDIAADLAKHLVTDSLMSGEFSLHALELKRALDLTTSPRSALMNAVDFATFRDSMENAFKNGALRVVKPDALKLKDDNLGGSEPVTGANNGSNGALFDIGETFAGKPVAFALSDPGDKPFEDGEGVTSDVTGKNKTLTYAAPVKSCWEVVIPDTTNTDLYGKNVNVKFHGIATPVELPFKRGAFDKNVSAALTQKMKDDLKKGFEDAVKGFDDGVEFKIQVSGHVGKSSSSQARIKAVRDYLGVLATEKIIQRKTVLARLKLVPGSLISLEPKGYGESINDKLYSAMYQALAYTHAVKNQIKEGTIVVHSSRASTVSTHVKEVKDYDNGGCETRDSEPDPATAIGLARADYKKLAVVYLISPNPDADTYLFKVSGKKPKALGAIMLHELGHSLWLQHVAATRTGMPRANAPKPDEHVKSGACLMSYDRETTQFCGLCMLRIRGWKWSELKSNDPYPTLTLEFRPGDMDAVFDSWTDTVEGKQQRLQVLGLFNRPLRHATETYGPFKDEFWECWDYSWKLAKQMFPGVETEGNKLNEALLSFVIEDGKIPEPGEQTKFRVAGHYAPFYANMDVAMRYGDAQEKNSRENQFKMNAVRGDIEAMFQADNPGIGALPVEVLVTDEQGEPMPGAEVWIHLVKPDAPTAWDPSFAGKKLLGATSFVKGTGPAPLSGEPHLAHVGKYFSSNIDTHEPGPDTDPQKGNVHHIMGGKRRMHGDAEDLATENGIRNVFARDWSHAHDIKPAVDGGGGKVKSAIMVLADDDGIARFMFTPSTVGGDRYKLKATARAPGSKIECGAVETGTFVVWKAHRLAGYYKMNNATTEAELHPPMLRWKKRKYREDDAGGFFHAAVPDLDLRRMVGDELARAYCEVFIEDEALRPQPIDAAFWRRWRQWVAKLAPEYGTEDYGMYMDAEGIRVPLREIAPKTYQGTIGAQVRRGCVGVWLGHPMATFQMNGINAHLDRAAADADTKVALVNLKKDDWIWGLDEDNAPSKGIFAQRKSAYKSTGGGDKLDAGSEYDYTTREITVKLKADHAKGAIQPTSAISTDSYGTMIEFIGATLDNTDEGVVHVKVKASRLPGLWNMYFYKSSQLRPEDMVARAKRHKAGGKDCTARACNNSGLSVKFNMGSAPVDGRVAFVGTGMPVAYAVFFPEQVIDVDHATADLSRSPWLMNFLHAADYNALKGAAYPTLPVTMGPKTGLEKLTGGGDRAEYAWSETVFLRALAATLRDQGFGYYPGQFIIQANYFNPIFGKGLGGKGVGNTALVFAEGKNWNEYLHYLVVHEVGHCLYGVHAEDEGGAKQEFHDPDAAFVCIMSGPKDLGKAPPKKGKAPEDDGGEKSARTYCGKCNAGLRGVLVMEGPLKKTGGTFVGNVAAFRAPQLGTPTGDMTIPDPQPDPHLDTPESDTQVSELIDLTDSDGDLEDSYEVAMELKPQEKSNWCWAATSWMMRRFYLKEDITQCKLASQALFDDGTDCCNPNQDARCNREHALALVGLDHDSSGEGTALAFDKIKSEIDLDHPFIVARAKHFLVCYGYAENDTGDQFVHIYDPLPVKTGSKRKMKYADYLAYINETVNLPEGGTGRGANYYNFRKKT